MFQTQAVNAGINVSYILKQITFSTCLTKYKCIKTQDGIEAWIHKLSPSAVDLNERSAPR
jgi:hypothetical protein